MQCRDLCAKASKARVKAQDQLEKLKDVKSTLSAEKKVAKTTPGSKQGNADDEKKKAALKAFDQKIKKNKEALEACKKKAYDIGEQLLVDLVSTIESKGNLNKMFKTKNGYEAGRFNCGSQIPLRHVAVTVRAFVFTIGTVTKLLEQSRVESSTKIPT